LGETPAACAIRECREESGYVIEIDRLLGVWSSLTYEYVHYPWKDNESIHVVFQAHIIDGVANTSDESSEVAWFAENELPPLSDGHAIRIAFGFKALKGEAVVPYFE
jgi:8-oxo-dGTP pyrophosphatase MutT (NUDIX family)